MTSQRRSVVIVSTVWIITTLLWLTPGITRPDGAGYYSYLPSILLGHDLVFLDEWERFGMISNGIVQHKEITATSHLGNHWTIGSAIGWLPGFVAGHTLRLINSAPRDGISLPYNVGVLTANALIALAALLLSLSAAREVVSSGGVPAVIGAWFGTPLLFYATRNSISPHVLATAVSALALVLALRLREGVTATRMISFGLAVGFAFSVRPQLATLALLPLFLVPRDRRGVLRHAPVAMAAALIGSLPQWIVASFLYGHPFGFLGIGSEATPFAAFERIWTWEPLFSWYHGLFTWTPYALLGVVGLVLLIKRDRGLAIAGTYLFVAQWLINATLERSFWGAWSFGQRRFDVLIPFFVVGVAMLVSVKPRLTTVLISVCALWTWLLYVATTTGLDLSIYHTPGELFASIERSLRSLPQLLIPFTFVPDVAKVRVFLLFGASCLLLLAAATIVALVARTTSQRNIAAIGVLLCISLAIVAASFNDEEMIKRYATTVALSREHQRLRGGADARVGLLRDEVLFLEKSGREAEALRTFRELQALVEARQGANR